MKKDENKKVHTTEHKPWELEKETEGLDELQGERLKKDCKKSCNCGCKE